jgi:hypothetical protein
MTQMDDVERSAAATAAVRLTTSGLGVFRTNSLRMLVSRRYTVS